MYQTKHFYLYICIGTMAKIFLNFIKQFNNRLASEIHNINEQLRVRPLDEFRNMPFPFFYIYL